MSQPYSTLQRDMANGRIYSSQRSRVTSPRAGPLRPAPAVAETGGPGAVPQPAQGYSFGLNGLSIPAANLAPGAAGSVSVTWRVGAAPEVSAQINGLRPMADPAVRPVLWLIHDLKVSPELSSADLALLPRGVSGTGNRPGDTFTLDGNPPTYGPSANTIAIAVSPGSFALAPDGSWRLSGRLEGTTNQALNPLALLGPVALPEGGAALPSGTVARILTDLFMRPSTVHPELNLRAHFQQRLAAILRDAAVSQPAPSFLEAGEFSRAAVTLEGLVRVSPRLMPTRETCCLLGATRNPI